MDSYEATKVVFSRVQSLDPENASKIMGLLLIQDHGEKEMIRLAFGPENLLHSVVVKARQELGVSPNTQLSNRQNSSRFLPNGIKIPSSLTLPTLLSPNSTSSSSSPTWVFSDDNTTTTNTTNSTLNPSTPPFYINRSGGGGGGGGEMIDERERQLQEQLSYFSEMEMGGGGGGCHPHRRSCSVSDISIGSMAPENDVSGAGWKPCLYYARGFCKNGSTCRFVHDSDKLEMMEHCHELFRSKSMQHQHHKLLAAAAMASASGSSSPTSAAAYSVNNNKGLSLFAQQQQIDSPRAAAAAAALMMGDDLQKFSRSPRGLENGGRADSSPASRQIYLTFPADSTFREEDVSSYFSIYGPVQDVRIPYQQKRMFGFVTFVYAETVKIILAKGNPHFVCDARVLVKPYKEKGKVPDKFRKQQQQMERGEFSSCNSPTGLDSRDPFDLPLGTRMMYDTQYILWKRKLEEQADLQQALELQSRRLMGLQLLDVKQNHHHRSLSTGAPPMHSPTQSPNSIFNQNLLSSDCSSPDASDENCTSPPLNETKQTMQQAINEASDREKEVSVVGEDNSNNANVKENPSLVDNLISLPESLEHNLPDSPFVSPKKGASQYMTAFAGSTVGGGVEALSNLGSASANYNSKASLFQATTTLDMAPFKSSCYFQMPRFSPGHGAIGM